MRILMLAESFAPIVGGVERIVESLSTALSSRGHEVRVATLRQPGGEEMEVEGVSVHHLGSTAYRIPSLGSDRERRHAPPVPDPEVVLGLRRLVRRTHPEIVHAHNWLLHSYLPLDGRSEAAVVLSMHDYGLVCATKRFLNRGTLCTGPATIKCVRCASGYYGPLKGPAIALATRMSEQRVRRHVDLFLPVSRAVGDLCRVHGPDVSVVPNFIDGLPEERPEDAELLTLLPDKPFILYFGDVTVDKGAYRLVEAYKQLEAPPPLVLVGRNYLDLDGVPGVIAFGRLPHRLAIAALRRSMFTVAPSVSPETFGLVALESAAAGKPIIASEIGGLGDVVSDGESGLLVPADDPASLLAALRRMIDDEPMRERMGEAAKDIAARFSPETVVPQFEAAYRRAIAERSKR